MEDIRDRSGGDLGLRHCTQGPEGKQNKVSASPSPAEDRVPGMWSVGPGVHLPLLQAPSGVLSSPWASVSSSVEWVHQLSLARLRRGFN